EPMRTVLIGVAMVILGVLARHANSQSLAREFESPSGRNVVQLFDLPSPLGGRNPPIQSLGKSMPEGECDPSAQSCASRFMSESHDIGWLNTDNYEWVGDRFLIFEDRSGVSVIDAERNQLLLNQVFAKYARAPNNKPFSAAIRRRPI